MVLNWSKQCFQFFPWKVVKRDTSPCMNFSPSTRYMAMIKNPQSLRRGSKNVFYDSFIRKLFTQPPLSTLLPYSELLGFFCQRVSSNPRDDNNKFCCSKGSQSCLVGWFGGGVTINFVLEEQQHLLVILLIVFMPPLRVFFARFENELRGMSCMAWHGGGARYFFAGPCL
jgi:hypothetical protein